MPFPRRWVVSGAAAAAFLVAVAGCADKTSSSSSSASSTPVRIGLLVALTGTYQPVGVDLKNGFQLYLNTHGGKLGGHPVELKTADEGDGAATAVPAATKLVKDDKVQVVTGLVGGGSVAAIAPMLNDAKIPLVGAVGRPELKDISRVWHTSFLSREPGAAIAQYVKDQVNGPVFAIGPDYQGGYDEVGGFTDEFTKIGGKLANPNGKTLWTPFPATTNFVPYLNQIKGTGAKAVFTFNAGKAAIDFVKQYAQSDAASLPLYAAGFLVEGGALKAEGDSAKNIYNSLNYSPDLDNQTNRTFVAAWKAAYPDAPPTTYAVSAYDAAYVLDKAIAAAGNNVNPDTINAAIGGLGQIDSPRGPWQFSKSTHTPVQKWYLRQVRNDGKALSNVMVQDLTTLGS